MAMGGGHFSRPRRMLLVEIPPKHVLHAIGAVEDADAQPLRHLFQPVEEHRFALAIDVGALLDEMIVGEHLFAEAPSIFREAQCGERTLALGQIDRIDGRIADGHRRMLGIDVDRRRVEIEIRRGAEEHESAHAMDVCSNAGAECDGNPIGILIATQFVRRAVDLQLRAVERENRHCERQPQRAELRLCRMRGAEQVGINRITLARDIMHFAARLLAVVRRGLCNAKTSPACRGYRGRTSPKAARRAVSPAET